MEYLRNIAIPPFTEDIFGNLLDVGTRKAVGYLPLSTIKEYGGEHIHVEFIYWADEKGLDFSTIKTGHTGSGAFYVWDEKMLQEILTKHKKVLKKAKIPTTTQKYIHFIEHNTVFDNKFPEAYKVIGLTFADKRFLS